MREATNTNSIPSNLTQTHMSLTGKTGYTNPVSIQEYYIENNTNLEAHRSPYFSSHKPNFNSNPNRKIKLGRVIDFDFDNSNSITHQLK